MASHPQYVPDFQIQINGQDLPSALRSSVTSVKFQEGRNASNRVEVGLANANLRWLQKHIKGLGFDPFPSKILAPGPALPGLTPDGLFDIDNKLTLGMGYTGQIESLFEGEITGVEANFPSSGAPSMMLVAHDYLHRLGEGSYARGFGPLPDFLIASILSAEHLLIPMIEPTIIAASSAIAAVNFIFSGSGTKQKGQSNLELLTEIAALYDSEFYVEGNVLYVTRFMKEYSPRLTLTWGENLMDFTPKVSTVGQAFGVGMKFTLREIPLDFLVTVFYDFDREAVGITVVPGVAAAAAAGGGPVFEIINRPIGSPADIANSALVIAHELRTKLNQRLTGSGTCIGNPQIRAGAVIRLDGLGPDFSGDYRVSSATHNLTNSGYTTSFEVRKELIP
jgi:phage protein D